jgi:hypothetical protein
MTVRGGGGGGGDLSNCLTQWLAALARRRFGPRRHALGFMHIICVSGNEWDIGK